MKMHNDGQAPRLDRRFQPAASANIRYAFAAQLG